MSDHCHCVPCWGALGVPDFQGQGCSCDCRGFEAGQLLHLLETQLSQCVELGPPPTAETESAPVESGWISCLSTTVSVLLGPVAREAESVEMALGAAGERLMDKFNFVP